MENNLPGRGSQLVFLIGAARSGTKIVRDVLSTHQALNVVPYDINFIWRTGNERLPHDELTPDDFKPKAHRRINRYLSKYLRDASFVIEKTVANTIRIPFLLSHYPDAKFIFLYRNGMDVCESVMRQWNSPSDKGYLVKKLAHVPIREIFTYGIKYALRTFNKNPKSYFWGVNYPELKDDVARYPVEMLAAHQWKYCVDKMLSHKKYIRRENLIEIKYEDFVLSPATSVESLLRFLDHDLDPKYVDLKNIKRNNIGKAVSTLTASQRELISAVIRKTMQELKYDI